MTQEVTSDLGTQPEPTELYFTKDGRLKLGTVPPTAYAWSYPWPPCPTNLSKNKVFRPKEEQFETVVKEVSEEFEKEAKPLDVEEIDGKPTDRSMVPEIELALYWDRHPFEFRPSSKALPRAKSAMNLSQVADLLCYPYDLTPNSNSKLTTHNQTEQNSAKIGKSSSMEKKLDKNSLDLRVRSASASSLANSRSSKNSSSKKNSIAESTRDNHNKNDTSPSPPHSETHESKLNPRIPKILQVLNKNEKRKFDDLPRRQSKDGFCTNPNLVRDIRDRDHSHSKSIGVQVTLDNVMSAALKSSYLCPLHGQYKHGVERRARSGFRTDMSSTQNPHSRCSKSRTRLMKCAEIQTDQEKNLSGYSRNNNFRKNRSQTAPPKRRVNPNMVSESRANFRHPLMIADAENRKLRNKILSFCYTKHSIF